MDAILSKSRSVSFVRQFIGCALLLATVPLIGQCTYSTELGRSVHLKPDGCSTAK